jgi:hypothetical protein
MLSNTSHEITGRSAHIDENTLRKPYRTLYTNNVPSPDSFGFSNVYSGLTLKANEVVSASSPVDDVVASAFQMQNVNLKLSNGSYLVFYGTDYEQDTKMDVLFHANGVWWIAMQLTVDQATILVKVVSTIHT